MLNQNNPIYLSYNNCEIIREMVKKQDLKSLVTILTLIDVNEIKIRGYKNFLLNFFCGSKYIDKFTLFYLVLQEKNHDLAKKILTHIPREKILIQKIEIFYKITTCGDLDLAKWFYYTYNLHLGDNKESILKLCRMHHYNDLSKWVSKLEKSYF